MRCVTDISALEACLNLNRENADGDSDIPSGFFELMKAGKILLFRKIYLMIFDYIIKLAPDMEYEPSSAD